MFSTLKLGRFGSYCLVLHAIHTATSRVENSAQVLFCQLKCAHPRLNIALGREALLKGRISTVDLHVLTGLDHLLFKLNLVYLFYKITHLNEEVNRTDPSP